MRITRKIIKKAFLEAETNIEFCWEFLVDLKEFNVEDNDWANRLISFQDKLATTIFNLQSIRDSILLEEKGYVKNKKKYKIEWFKSKLRLLASFRDGIDNVVSLTKLLGDSYAYFFYQHDLELLSEHLSHQIVINHNAGIGERGELEFIKKIKHLEGHFTLFHGITNILRYGDFSFVNLKNLKVEKIGELKTSKVDDKTLNLNISILKRIELKKQTSPIKDSKLEETRRGRQILGIANFLRPKVTPNSTNKNIIGDSYAKEIDILIRKSKLNKPTYTQVSEGLVFVCIKLRRTNLYNRIFKRRVDIIEQDIVGSMVVEAVKKLMKPNSTDNSLVINHLMKNADKSLYGSIPLFWQPIKCSFIKDIYFADCHIISLFNPIYLIEKIENMGFIIDSKYSNRNKTKKEENVVKTIKRFDLFLPYITEYLLTENFVIESINAIENHPLGNTSAEITIKPQQRIDIFNYKSNHKRRSKTK